ncbi:MAG: hydantoinase B/oxoprolinase family protein [Gemmatimonadota bacterium]|nr:hydantoinase B/oxoprolinase family protein [Gemmatimonadota bacterium]
MTSEFDPIRVEVFRNALTAIADEMGIALRRAAYSTNIKTRLDYSCAVFDADGKTLAQAFTQPIHLGTLRHFVPRILGIVDTGSLGPGDAVLCNDGHLGGIHLNDVCLVAPVHNKGLIVAYVATIAHHVDIGGGTPGSIGLFEEIYQEGLQIPPVKIVKAGQVDEELLSLITRNVRSQRETAGDLRAQIAGVNIGERRIVDLIRQHQVSAFADLCDAVIDHGERVTRSAIAASVPDGRYGSVGYLDDDGFDDRPVEVVVDIEVSDGTVVYDLRRSAAQRRASINTTYAMSFSACAYTLRALLGDTDIPVNEGFYRCIDVLTEPGTVCDALRPAAIGAGADVGGRVLEVALSAFGKRLPHRVPADTKGTMCNVGFGGIDPRTGESFAFYEAQAGGYGGRQGLDGMDAVQPHMQNTENSPIEETEANYPVAITRYELIEGSGGAGEFRGGMGLRRDYQFEGDVKLSIMADRVKFSPQGLAGGLPGHPCRFIIDPDGEARQLPSKFSITVPAGTTMSVQIAGGGGYGDPSDRDPAAIASDLKNGLISRAQAKQLYGYGVSNIGVSPDLDTP